MAVKTLILLVAIAWATPAFAEKVKTNQPTKIHSRPGEQSKVLFTLKAGQQMTMIGKSGRWLKVRVQGRTGYVARSKVDNVDDGRIARNTRRRPFVDGRSKRRGFGGDAGPEDRVGADAIGEGLEGGGGAEDEDDDDDDDDEVRPRKKPAAKARPKTAAASKPTKRSRGDDDDDDDDDVDDGDESDEAAEDAEEDKGVKRRTARVRKTTGVYTDPDEDADEDFLVRPTDVLYPEEQEGAFTYIETDEGDSGYILTSALVFDREGGGGGLARRTLDVRARLGFMFIQQGMRSAGSTAKEPDNYNIGTSSAAIALGAAARFPFKDKYILGAELAYEYANTVAGGVPYTPPMGAAVTIGLSIHNLNLRGLAGMDLGMANGMAVYGRLGYRYQSFLVADVTDPAKNPAPLRLPSESISAPTLGAALDIPRLGDSLGLQVGIDLILAGASVSQTKGLEDGTTPTAKAVVLGAGVTYKWQDGIDLIGTYDLKYMGLDFGPPAMGSERMHMGTRVTRTDFFHMVTVGILKGF
jgi:hypothetical protein